MILSNIKSSFLRHFPDSLIDELLTTYQDMKNNFFLNHLRPNEVEGGRFCETVFRILEYITTQSYTPLGKPIDTDTIIRNLANLPATSFSDSIRLHIPRTLRVVYDIRNKRDVAHLADDIDSNIQDATLVCSCCDWMLAEFVRLYHGANPNETQAMIEHLVTRKIPAIQEFGSLIKTLNPKLSVSERVLLILYHKKSNGITFDLLSTLVTPSQRKNLKRVLSNLEHNRDTIVFHDNVYEITRLGESEVEKKQLILIK
jgi:hypothetical protein